MDIQVGDRVTYKNLEEKIVTTLIGSSVDIGSMKEILETRELLKIERPKYELVEEHKKLLTEEEKEFLKMISKIRIDGISHIRKRNGEISITGTTKSIVNYIPTNKFKGLNEDEAYTLKELGLK